MLGTISVLIIAGGLKEDRQVLPMAQVQGQAHASFTKDQLRDLVMTFRDNAAAKVKAPPLNALGWSAWRTRQTQFEVVVQVSNLSNRGAQQEMAICIGGRSKGIHYRHHTAPEFTQCQLDAKSP